MLPETLYPNSVISDEDRIPFFLQFEDGIWYRFYLLEFSGKYGGLRLVMPAEHWAQYDADWTDEMRNTELYKWPFVKLHFASNEEVHWYIKTQKWELMNR